MAIAAMGVAAAAGAKAQPATPRFWESRSQTDEGKAEGARRAASEVACMRALYGQDYHPQPAVWELRDADTTIWLLGTVHELPLSFEWKTPQIEAIIAAADTLMVEATDTPKPGELDPFDAAGTAAALPPLIDRVSGARREALAARLATVPPDVRAVLDRLPSVLAAWALDTKFRKREQSYLVPGVDRQLTRRFRDTGRPVLGLEDGAAVRRQLGRVFADLPADAQQAALERTIDQFDVPVTVRERWAVANRWARGAMEDEPLEDLADPIARTAFGKRLQATLADDRNAAWTQSIAGRLVTPGKTLVALGTAHFRGAGSVIARLRALGLTVERISPTGAPKPRPPFPGVPRSVRECETVWGTASPTASEK